MSDTVQAEPALSAEEWAGVPRVYFREPRQRAEQASCDDGFGVELDANGTMLVWDDSWGLTVNQEDRHALAALALHKQPFGFTRADLDIIEQARQHVLTATGVSMWGSGVIDTHDTFPLRALAAKIAALLPPAPR